jgi:5-methylcytosine-specific restriction endonuclease McrA
VDHVVPLSDPLGAQLAHDELNLRVLCRSHNAERDDRCTDQQRQQVLDAIEGRRKRQQRYCLCQIGAQT